MADYVDWFNFMAYDIHGTWDGTVSNWTFSDMNPHTNLTKIAEGLDLLWRNDSNPGKVLLGLGFYGCFFTLADSSCDMPGYIFDISAYGRIISEYNPTVVYSETARVNWMTWNKNEWVSFDNSKTLKQKADFANSRCLGGLFSWALDLGGPGSLEKPNNMSASDTSMDGASTDGGDFYVGQEIFDNHTVVGVGPINMIFPPSTLDSPTTIQPDPFVTLIEVSLTTTETVPISKTAVPTITITQVIVTTTITLGPIITSEIPYWNWNITAANQPLEQQFSFPAYPSAP
ncbi:glycoside hydrolase superfamily [Aspergillus cavernicola]|uniref:chitinase n=1 Tax=Aspergillus cavernicola TaxID=176166 RepID=A0ABR4HEZ6_9EURO